MLHNSTESASSTPRSTSTSKGFSPSPYSPSLFSIPGPIINRRHLRVAVLAPLVVLVVELLGEGDVGDDDRVDGRGRVAGLGVGVAARVVLVLGLVAARLPRRAALGDVHAGLGRGAGRVAACWLKEEISVSFLFFSRVLCRLRFGLSMQDGRRGKSLPK